VQNQVNDIATGSAAAAIANKSEASVATTDSESFSDSIDETTATSLEIAIDNVTGETHDATTVEIPSNASISSTMLNEASSQVVALNSTSSISGIESTSTIISMATSTPSKAYSTSTQGTTTLRPGVS
jgi:hypothetical protein